jgi:hypothetical protein
MYGQHVRINNIPWQLPMVLTCIEHPRTVVIEAQYQIPGHMVIVGSRRFGLFGFRAVAPLVGCHDHPVTKLLCGWWWILGGDPG